MVVSLACVAPGPAIGGLDGALASGALPQVLSSAISQYSSVGSYADTGTIRRETPGIVDEARFTTRFRRTSGDLYFDYQPLTSTTTATKFSIDIRGQRTVVWMVASQMQRYDFASRTQETVPPGSGQVRALQGLTHATQGTSILIPSLLFPKAKLPSAILQLESATVAGVEPIGGRPCHKVVGTAAARYPSGQRTGVRPVTLWIDAESNLIRRVFEDTPEGYPSAAYLRTTVTIEPQANPAIPDDGFEFKPPK